MPSWWLDCTRPVQVESSQLDRLEGIEGIDEWEDSEPSLFVSKAKAEHQVGTAAGCPCTEFTHLIGESEWRRYRR